MTPLEDKILVSPVAKKEKTESGLFLPDSQQARDSRGYVVAVGPGVYASDGKRIPLDVEVGDMVFYTANAGTDVELSNVKYLVLRQSEVLCKVSGS